jgi:hypothetical protein
MTSITLTTTIGEDRHLELDLPRDVPAGRIELVIRPIPADISEQPELTREEIKARLRAAGLLMEGRFAPPDAVPLSDEEIEEIGRQFASPQLMSDLIDEDRGPR